MRVHLPVVRPVLTYGFLAANIVIFGLNVLLGSLLFVLGAKDNSAIVAGEYWRLVTPIFLHGGLLHLAVNSYSLFLIGPQIERPFGYVRFVTLYLLSGIAGAMASFALTDVPSIGASGAIFGLVGALVPFLYRNRGLFGSMARQRLIGVAQVIILNLLIGLSPNSRIDNWGHIGGLLGGLILGWLITPVYKLEQDVGGGPRLTDISSPTVAWLAITLFTGGLAVLTWFLILLRSGL